ncbi:MAG: curved DNA-binding protein CbpA [Polyangiales bacterium]|jgi:curved DNA-binding protein CbpA
MSLDDLDYYTLLSLDDRDDLPAIKKAFRDFARKYHPDIYAGKGKVRVEQATVIYRRGSEAYQVLTDTKLRAAYDEALQSGRTRLSGRAMDRALAPVPPPAKKKNDDVPIQTPHALAQYKEGIAAAHRGDWKTAWRYLKQAHESEPENEFIASRFFRVERKLRNSQV